MEKEYGDLYYFDVNEIIKSINATTQHQREFVKKYLEKIAINADEDTLIVISPMDSKTFGSLLLDIINGYEIYKGLPSANS